MSVIVRFDRISGQASASIADASARQWWLIWLSNCASSAYIAEALDEHAKRREDFFWAFVTIAIASSNKSQEFKFVSSGNGVAFKYPSGRFFPELGCRLSGSHQGQVWTVRSLLSKLGLELLSGEWFEIYGGE
jgi:hypothetical protein